MLIAIICGFQFSEALMKPEKDWLSIGFFGVMCTAASIFYFKERTKRMSFFRERMNKGNDKKKK
jgi:hypothetical protein